MACPWSWGWSPWHLCRPWLSP